MNNEENEETPRTDAGTPMLNFSSMGDEPKKPIKKEVMQNDDIKRTAAGTPMLSFPKSEDQMELARIHNEEIAAKDRKNREVHDQEMANIAEHGPLDRINDEVVEASEEEKEISNFIKTGNVEGLKSVVRSEMEALGADYEDFEALDYYERFLASPDPEIRAEVIEIARRVIRLQKKHLKGR